nr:hypothetical protein B0A51_07322 [Rachicladosporium sp. CCFEE 5018]OQO30984.1 hypothetical protein B0A51_01223 [Rachicladosporium sp. CCFEE 5018]
MSNGPSVPTPILPSGAMPHVPVLTNLNNTIDTTTTSDAPKTPTRPEYPFKLRSHSDETIPTFRSFVSSTPAPPKTSPHTPNSPRLNPTKPRHRHRRSLSHHNIRPQSAGCYTVAAELAGSPVMWPTPASPKGLGDYARTGASPGDVADGGYPVVPCRPPLKPTISFGSVSRFSYYSDFSEDMVQKSKDLAESEERERQEEEARRDEGGWWRSVMVCFGCRDADH